MITPIPEEDLAPLPVPATPRTASRNRPRWTSCCVEVDRGAAVYLGQMAFSAALIALCAVMLAKAEGSCDKSSPYISLLSFLAGKVLSSVADSAH
jgi:hypothetical protein